MFIIHYVYAINDVGVEINEIKGIVVDTPIDKNVEPLAQSYGLLVGKHVNENIVCAVLARNTIEGDL